MNISLSPFKLALRPCWTVFRPSVLLPLKTIFRYNRDLFEFNEFTLFSNKKLKHISQTYTNSMNIYLLYFNFVPTCHRVILDVFLPSVVPHLKNIPRKKNMFSEYDKFKSFSKNTNFKNFTKIYNIK
jgi:hypothetical protein